MYMPLCAKFKRVADKYPLPSSNHCIKFDNYQAIVLENFANNNNGITKSVKLLCVFLVLPYQRVFLTSFGTFNAIFMIKLCSV